MNKEAVIGKFVSFLDKQNIDYALLGTAHDFSNHNGDIDFAVPKAVFWELDKLVRSFCKASGFTVVQKLKHESTACFYVVASYHQESGSHFFYQLDFCSDYKRSGRHYLSSGALMRNRIYNNELKYWQLNPVFSFVYYFIKKTDKGNLEPKHFCELHACWQASSEGIRAELQFFFSRNEVQQIANAFDAFDPALLLKKLPSLKASLHDKIKIRARDFFAEKIRLVQRVIRPAGLVVGVLGRDGSGKTTFIDGLVNNINPCFRQSKKFHLYPGLILKHKAENKATHAPHNQKRRPALLSFAKMNLFLAEYLFGFWVKVLPAKIRGNIVVFDRYFIDLYADPLRYRNGENKWLVRSYYKLIPKPDLWFILDVPSDVLLQRKNELSFEAAEKLRAEYLQLGHLLKNSTVINTACDPRFCTQKATGQILKYMSVKTV